MVNGLPLYQDITWTDTRRRIQCIAMYPICRKGSPFCKKKSGNWGLIILQQGHYGARDGRGGGPCRNGPSMRSAKGLRRQAQKNQTYAL